MSNPPWRPLRYPANGFEVVSETSHQVPVYLSAGCGVHRFVAEAGTECCGVLGQGGEFVTIW